MILFLVHRAANADDARALAWRLRWHDCTPAAVWTGADDDARATATILADVLDWRGMIETHDALAAAATDPRELIGALEATDAGVAGFAVVLIGHEPTLSSLAAHFFDGPALEPLAPGEALRLDDQEVRWRFSHDGAAPVRGPEPAR